MPPLTPEQLAEASARLDGLTQKLEKTILDDICRRIVKAGTVTDTAEWQMLRLKEMGYANDIIEQAVSDYTKKSAAEVQQLFHEAAQVSDIFYSEMYTQSGKPFVPVEDNPYMQQLITAAADQTKNELVNLTRSMGFAVRQPDGSVAFQPAAKAYQSALDLAQMQVATGTFDYTTAVRNSVKALTDGGLQFVDYASGHRNRADVAARRAILTGLSQMTGKVSEHNAEELETDIVEVTAHAGARPDHAEWQGRRYSLSGKSKEYPSLEEATGYGTGDGLKGWNCRHDFYPVIPGISPPAYTEEQLANIDPPPIEYNGKTLTYYECTQKQRVMETAMRKTKREIIAAKASGDEDMFTAKSIRLRRQKEEYAKFSDKAGLLTQNERTQVYGFDKSISAKAAWAARKAAKPLDNGGGSGIMKSRGYDFLDGVLGSDTISKKKRKKLDRIISVIPKKHLDVIGKTVKEVEIVPNRGQCTYYPDSKKLVLDPDKMNGSIVHEFGHVLADAYDIYNDKEFLNILADGLDLKNGSEVKWWEFEDIGIFYWIENPKFIDKYQGRVYVGDEGFDYKNPIKPSQLQEYFSVAFDAYFNNPELLKSKDKKLFDYLERMINDG